jgi:polyisoprenoid-binding protein YceI
MKTFFYSIVTTTILITSAFVITPTNEWKIIQGKYSVKFTTEEAVGDFKGLTGEIKFDETNLNESFLKMVIDVNTIQTGNDTKNAHAKEADWLDAANYPTIQFISSSITKETNGFQTKGKLTMKDVTKEITIPFTFTKKKKSAVIKGGFSVKRSEYNVNADGIGETIKIQFTIPVKQ